MAAACRVWCATIVRSKSQGSSLTILVTLILWLLIPVYYCGKVDAAEAHQLHQLDRFSMATSFGHRVVLQSDCGRSTKQILGALQHCRAYLQRPSQTTHLYNDISSPRAALQTVYRMYGMIFATTVANKYPVYQMAPYKRRCS